ncbi:hypothetical protein MHYP_G00007590 [Metynnis hypsauchen]
MKSKRTRRERISITWGREASAHLRHVPFGGNDACALLPMKGAIFPKPLFADISCRWAGLVQLTLAGLSLLWTSAPAAEWRLCQQCCEIKRSVPLGPCERYYGNVQLPNSAMDSILVDEVASCVGI